MVKSELRLIFGLCAAFGLAGASSPSFAAETWRCEYSKAGAASKSSTFRISGDHLVETQGDVMVRYRLIANDEKAIVAAHGGGYASEPEVMAFTVLIDKLDGRIVLSATSVGDLDYREIGRCKSTPAARP